MDGCVFVQIEMEMLCHLERGWVNLEERDAQRQCRRKCPGSWFSSVFSDDCRAWEKCAACHRRTADILQITVRCEYELDATGTMGVYDAWMAVVRRWT